MILNLPHPQLTLISSTCYYASLYVVQAYYTGHHIFGCNKQNLNEREGGSNLNISSSLHCACVLLQTGFVSHFVHITHSQNTTKSIKMWMKHRHQIFLKRQAPDVWMHQRGTRCLDAPDRHQMFRAPTSMSTSGLVTLASATQHVNHDQQET